MIWEDEKQKKKNNSDKILKILVILIIVFVILIVGILLALYIIKANMVVFTVDGKSQSYSEGLIIQQNNTEYVNIQEMAKILGYDYHKGEYKEYAEDPDKCYIVSKNETASFYLNSNKISKIGIDKLEEEYKIFNSSYNTIKINDMFYAPKDAIETAFSIRIKTGNKKIEVLTLSYLVKLANSKINADSKNLVYQSLENESFENQKALLYGYIIACKIENNLYTIKSLQDLSEIVSDKYTQINFIEETREFLVTNIIGKVGIINEDGQNKIEQNYDSIKLINTNPKLYMVGKNEKFGVINENDQKVIYEEYDKIGLKNAEFSDVKNNYVLLNGAIPVANEEKYGLFNLEGKELLSVTYADIGCKLTTAQIGEISKTVNPVAVIEECNGIVIKKGETYDLYLLDTNQVVSLKVSQIYSLRENGKTNYYMIYKEKEMNLLENLIKLGYIKERNNESTSQENSNEETNINTTNTENNANLSEITQTDTNLVQ